MSFSMAATPESLMLQHRQPLDNSNNSSVSAVGSEEDATLIALAIDHHVSQLGSRER